MHDREWLLKVSRLLCNYSSHLMGCGVHTSRVVRNTKRLGQAFDVYVTLSTFQNTMSISVMDTTTNKVHSEIFEVEKSPILFSHNTELSALSWEAIDNKLLIEEVEEKYNKILSSPLLHPSLILLMASLANSAFCKLFGGDSISMIIVFFATALGFFIKQIMIKWMCNTYMTIFTSSFLASLICSTSFWFDCTSDICMTTSVLYLIPGVPLVNGVIDIIEGYTLIGLTRLINCFLIILFISVGLGLTLILIK